MAIANLSTLSTSLFKGGAHLTGTSSTALAGRLNTIISKINEIIDGSGALEALYVGDEGDDGYYGGAGHSWIEIDGTNPPTLAAIRWLDQVDGTYYTTTCQSGVLTTV